MTPRAQQALRTADLVCAEDTRVTGKLLSAFDIEKPLMRLDEEKMTTLADEVLDKVESGMRVAFCSDAGMPGVSDPGQRLIAAAYKRNLSVEVMPGPTACDTAYVKSGFLCPRFYFGGFFPRKTGEQQRLLESLKALDSVLIFYESPRRVISAVETIQKIMPYRTIAICRELTKLHEELIEGSASEVLNLLHEHNEQGRLKGEIVLLIDAPNEKEKQNEQENAELDAYDKARALAEEGLSKKDIVRALKKECGISRNAAYEIAMSV